VRLTLEETTARLAALVRKDLAGAELQEFALIEDEGTENAYIVRWAMTEGVPFDQYGTHRACLAEDGRSMLVWGHYTQDEENAKADYADRLRK